MKLASGTTARAVEEWMGKNPDTPIPDRVVLRILERQGGKCAKTGVKLYAGKFIKEHVKPLWLGGENRESNIALYADEVSKEKTRAEATVRAKVNRMKAKHLLPKPKSKIKSRGFNQPFEDRTKYIDRGDMDT